MPKIDIKKVIELRDSGLTYREIAAELKCSSQSCYNIIRKKRDYAELQKYRELDAAMKLKAKEEMKEQLKKKKIGEPLDEIPGVSERDIKLEVVNSFRPTRGVRAKNPNLNIPYGTRDEEKEREWRRISKERKEEKARFEYGTPQQEYGSPDPISTTGGEVVPDTTPSVFLSRLETMHQLPPGGGSAVTYPWQNYAGVFRAGQDFYLPADIAIQQSRENARNMWNNLIIRESLQSRMWAAAEQEWHIEPFDPSDDRQQELAKQIQKTIENIPDFLKLRYSLLKSRFFGTYGVQLVYQWDKQRRLSVKKWNELHGDSLVFKMSTDEVGVYVSSTGYKDAKDVTTEAGYIGRVHVYEDGTQLKFDEKNRPYYPVGTNEREAIIIMKYDPQATDFLDSRNAGGIVGLGLRSTIYPTWYMMQEMTGNLVDLIERIGTGIVMMKFLRGNEASYNSAVQLAESMSNQSVVMVPVDVEHQGKILEGVEIIQPTSIGVDNLLKVIQDLFEAQIRRFVVGQDSTSQPVQTGLGSKIASVQESTFGRIVTFDCVDLQETLTHQLVKVIQKWNHPGTEHIPCKFVVDYSRPNVDAQINAAKTLHDMGIELDKDQLRNLAGFSKPLPGADTTEEKKEPMMPGMMGQPGEVPPQLQEDGEEIAEDGESKAEKDEKLEAIAKEGQKKKKKKDK